ncbi:MAG: hybrid sensor histidine kinase/response regulator [Alphaproteobacteria bacterium]|nr:hybrid sensor histidine kinase/response regulator [Alphaproteobacteria bacterium]
MGMSEFIIVGCLIAVLLLLVVMGTIHIMRMNHHGVGINTENEPSSAVSKVQFMQLCMLSLSHEVRTPMQAIVAMSGLLQDQMLTPEMKKWVNTIQQTSQNLLETVNGFLYLSKLEQNFKVIGTQPVDVQQLVRHVVSMFDLPLKDKCVNIKLDLAIPLYHIISSDPIFLRHIVMNILSNAVKYSDKGTITVTVGLSRLGQNNDFLLVEIMDNGSGMSDLEKKKMSQFFSEKNNIDDNLITLGMGLFVTRQMVRALSGSIVFSDNRKGGTICRIDIPVTVNQVSWMDDPSNSNEGSSEAPVQCIKVLIFQNAGLQPQTLCQLQQEGFMDIYSTNDAAEALVLIKENEIRLVFCDLFDIYGDGKHIAQLLKEAYPEIPVLALTKETLGASKEQLNLLGIDAILVAPFDAELIYQSAAAWVKQTVLLR